MINRGPSVPLEHRIPEEVWSGKEVKLSHLKVFGCVAYVHINDQGRNKLDPKSKKCTLIGYDDDAFGYRIWDDENKKVILSRDVIFDERVMYKDMHKIVASNSDLNEPVFVDADDVLDSPVTEPIVASPQPDKLVG